jgi:glucokinase
VNPRPSELALGVDVGGTKVLGLAVDASGTIVARVTAPTPQRSPAAKLGELVTDVVARTITDLEVATGGAAIDAPACVGLPGMVRRDGVLAFAPHLRGASGLDLGRALPERGGAMIAVRNDADCAAVAEQQRGAAGGHNDVVIITLGTGIGGGVIVDGTLLRGANGFAGEFGHMVIETNGPECPCGARGCWERYASGSAVGRFAREAAQAGRLEGVVASAGGDAEAVRGEHVTAAALAGDEEALEILDRVGWWLARGLANLVASFDPSCIVIGGGLSQAASLLVPAANRYLADLLEGGRSRPPVAVVTAAFGPDAGAMGASLIARGER